MLLGIKYISTTNIYNYIGNDYRQMLKKIGCIHRRPSLLINNNNKKYYFIYTY